MKLVFVMLSVIFVTTNLWVVSANASVIQGDWFSPNCPECQRMQQSIGYGRLSAADTAFRPGVVVKKKPKFKKAGQQ